MKFLSRGYRVSRPGSLLRIEIVARRGLSPEQAVRAIRCCARLAIGMPIFMLLTSCWYGSTERYVHEPTEELRQILQESSRKLGEYMRDVSAETVADGNLYLIPSFRYFGDGYAEDERRASLLFLSGTPTSIRIERVRITNRDSGYSLEREIGQLADVRGSAQGYYRGGIILLNSSDNARFINANSLHVEIWYRPLDGARTRAEFEIRRTTIREWKSITV